MFLECAIKAHSAAPPVTRLAVEWKPPAIPDADSSGGIWSVLLVWDVLVPLHSDVRSHGSLFIFKTPIFVFQSRTRNRYIYLVFGGEPSLLLCSLLQNHCSVFIIRTPKANIRVLILLLIYPKDSFQWWAWAGWASSWSNAAHRPELTGAQAHSVM